MTVPEKVRSFTLLGAPGCGKTILTEALLFRAKVLPQTEGGKTLDTEPEEIKRQVVRFFEDSKLHLGRA